VEVQPEPMMPHQIQRTREEEAAAADLRSYKRTTPSKHPPRMPNGGDEHCHRGGISELESCVAMLAGETDVKRGVLRSRAHKYLHRQGHKGDLAAQLRDAEKHEFWAVRIREHQEWLLEQAKETPQKR